MKTKSQLPVAQNFLFFTLLFTAFSSLGMAQTPDSLASQTLKRMTMEELLNIEVTSVSKRAEKLTEVASAIQVITNEDIRRSGATTLPEALRLASNLQVSQANSSSWIISSRGFNAAFSNKLLVMIDGRTVYSPLFAGVFWDVQNVLLEDIERIEVISGPGGTIWGANAVNGIINIITKSSKDTKGVYASVSAGNFLKDNFSLRYGGEIGENVSFRLYGNHYDIFHTYLPDGSENTDNFGFTQGGLRLDWTLSERDDLMITGNSYFGDLQVMDDYSSVDGQNLMARWQHRFNEKSNLFLQAFADRTWRRDIPSTINDQLHTFDIEIDHFIKVRNKHQIIWGVGYRNMQNLTVNETPFAGFDPENIQLELISFYVQDEIELFPEKIKLILGTKFQYNTYTKMEVQPNARLAWTPNNNHTLWTSVSRAVRTPSRLDVDLKIPNFPVPPESPSINGGPNFESEEVIAYEAGYRVQPDREFSLAISGFYNQYDDLYSVDSIPGTRTFEIMNGTMGSSFGVEISGTYEISEFWRLKGGYSFFEKNLKNKPWSFYDYSDIGNDANHIAFLQSTSNIFENFQFDVIARYTSMLPNPEVPEYFMLNVRLAWQFNEWAELSIVGQHLLMEKHLEILNQIPRNFYGKVTCRF